MENRKPTEYSIEGHEGRWIVENSWISDLGLVMIKFYNLDKKVWMSVNTGTTLDQALKQPWERYSEETKKGPNGII